MNDENLIPLGQRTKSEQREISRKGGEASGKARRKKRTLSDRLRMIGEMVAKGSKLIELEAEGLTEEDRLSYIALKLYQEAEEGNVAAILAIRDTIGEKPSNNINLNGEVDNKITIEFVRTGNTPKEREDDISDE